MNTNFLPINKKDLKERDIDQLDFVYISGDAYVDHPSFGHAIITRILEKQGYSVGIIAQPNWKDVGSFKVLGRPRLGFLVSSGNIDSMVNHYTAAKKPRGEDSYTPGGLKGKRPDRALIVYCNKLREAYKDVPIIVGGVEASLRRFAHYDYWDNTVRRCILLDAKADLLVYGMGEKPIVEIADSLNAGIPIEHIRYVAGTTYASAELDPTVEAIQIPGYEEVVENKHKYAKAFMVQQQEMDVHYGKRIVQPHGDQFIIQNPPPAPLTQEEMDAVYALPYARNWHPSYDKAGGVPAIEEIKFSITSQRGCFGSCSFCALNYHQGRVIQNRSHESILAEAKLITEDKDFKGYIHDVGGPTANFRNAACDKQKKLGVCKDRQCLYPSVCKNMKVDHNDYIDLLRKVRALPKIKKVFIRSGIRFDYVMADQDDTFFKELCEFHVSGQLKVAPEHVSERVLRMMGKPKPEVYEKFRKKYFAINKKINKEQYLVPYLISSHPGSDIHAAIELAEYVRDIGYNPEQIQDFYPTPGTLSTTMYYTGLDPRNMRPVYTPQTPEEKYMQKALIQYRNPRNYERVHAALVEAGREDLIGYDKKCLIRPRGQRQAGYRKPGTTTNSTSKANETRANETKGKTSRDHMPKGNAPKSTAKKTETKYKKPNPTNRNKRRKGK